MQVVPQIISGEEQTIHGHLYVHYYKHCSLYIPFCIFCYIQLSFLPSVTKYMSFTCIQGVLP